MVWVISLVLRKTNWEDITENKTPYKRELKNTEIIYGMASYLSDAFFKSLGIEGNAFKRNDPIFLNLLSLFLEKEGSTKINIIPLSFLLSIVPL